MDGIFVPSFSDARPGAEELPEPDPEIEADPRPEPRGVQENPQTSEFDLDDLEIENLAFGEPRIRRPLMIAVAAAALSLLAHLLLLVLTPAASTAASTPHVSPGQAAPPPGQGHTSAAKPTPSNRPRPSPPSLVAQAPAPVPVAAPAARSEHRRPRPLRLRPTLRSSRRARRSALGARSLHLLEEAGVIYADEAYARARSHYRRAVRLDPKNDDARFGLALSAFQIGRVREATRQVKTTLALNPDHPEAHILLGFLNQLRRRPRKAATHYARYLALSPDGEWAGEIRAILATFEPHLKKPRRTP